LESRSILVYTNSSNSVYTGRLSWQLSGLWGKSSEPLLISFQRIRQTIHKSVWIRVDPNKSTSTCCRLFTWYKRYVFRQGFRRTIPISIKVLVQIFLGQIQDPKLVFMGQIQDPKAVCRRTTPPREP